MKNRYQRKKEPAENRRLLLEVAFGMVSELGIDALTLEAVAARAGLSKGGLLHHFPSKSALQEALFRESLDQFSASIRQEREQSPEISPAMAYFRAALTDLASENRRRALLFLFQAAMKEEYYRTHLTEWYREHLPEGNGIASLLTVLVADGLWNAGVFGFYTVTEEQQSQIITLLEQLNTP
ncbi:TetR/AcrR family transcriptional regulator [Siphonobacter aquaeclarae]|jgi:AcrR family transcriptional regulator|uniref:Transcriptional regulator, TetR family n=1 Tax=Siphonobacter aquaeclarae TaxID=563176 RepID=A0A1G9QHB0_9BACT|nr:TetR family transcriptional regulator [Siphonobacter aquaeclarae]MBO9637382.1 TetR family transcriptional regulator [Siphonobacter aquaeclarae]SDM09867.1 transcriptional regulator, TetR family [Siphonobacter aquaeclarae]